MRNLFKGFPIVFLLFFIFLGYLEAGWMGAIAGLVFPLLASYLLPLALVPIVGIVLWWLVTNFLLSNILHYIPVFHLFTKVMLFYLVWAVLINIAITIVTIIVLWLIKRFINREEVEQLGITWDDIRRVIELLKAGKWKEAIELIYELIKKIDLKLIGTALFWLGIGIASHDFWWEACEYEIDVERPTHGTWVGLQIASIGLRALCIEDSFFDRLKKMLYFYLGFAISALGFLSLSFLPKGAKRVISHILWWSGVTLMVYNWYILIRDHLWKKAKHL